ncbi:MAG: hypothetical protein WAW17_07235 [Rhodococcus sp. (in: high G+C Gram-positive bacteria)]|uniref:hypothetical protein n=1 Tax=Rhodococcus sp. TaxID=1831 RepID=UPI003BB0CF64
MNEPIYVEDPEYFQGDEWSPEKLRDLAQSMNPGTIEQVQRTWRALGEEAGTKIAAFADGIRREIGGSWHGVAASAADDKAARYGGSADAVKTQLEGVAGSFDPIYNAASQLRGGAVPEVQGLNWYDNLTPWKTDRDDEYYRRHEEALQAMNNIYRPGVQGTDEILPVFGRLEDIVDPPDPIMPTSGSNPGGTAGSPGSSGSAPFAHPGGVPSADGAGLGSAPATALGDGAAPGVDQTPGSPLAGDGNPTSTNAASADGVPTTPNLPGAGDASRLGGNPSIGHGGGAGAAGLGSGTSGPVGGMPTGSSAGSRIPGAVSGAGGPAGGRSGGLAGATGAGAGARGSGMGAGGMMGAPGARGGGNDDKEHAAPDYLITLDNGNELIGRLPAVAPPVIGA